MEEKKKGVFINRVVSLLGLRYCTITNNTESPVIPIIVGLPEVRVGKLPLFTEKNIGICFSTAYFLTLTYQKSVEMYPDNFKNSRLIEKKNKIQGNAPKCSVTKSISNLPGLYDSLKGSLR